MKIKQNLPPTSDSSSDGVVDQFIRRARQEKPIAREKPLLSEDKQNEITRVAGLILGLLSGFLFTLTSQWINTLLLPGFRLYQPPFGLGWNLLLFTSLGVVMGLGISLKDCERRWVLSIFLCGLLLLTGYLVLARGSGSWLSRLVDFLSSSFFALGALLLMVAIAFPFFLLMSLAARAQVEHNHRPWYAWQRMALSLVTVLAAALIGLLAIYSPEERRAMVEMNSLVEVGLASDAESLPEPFREMEGAKFADYASGSYVIYSDRSVQTSGIVSERWRKQPQVMSAAQFENGYSLVCRFPSDSAQVFCHSIYQPE